jgi:alkanesulfonate monooxygenase SsuD/methylene tetrahydromethanopterin reductase-like flavin-dependent oxidoreductase (luciferase family)
MRSFEIGIVLPLAQEGPTRVTPRWPEIRDIALRCEQIGFDTIWTPDELPPRGIRRERHRQRRIRGIG